MTRYKKLPTAKKYQKLTFQVKETVLTTQPKCMPVNLAEEKEKFIHFGQTPQFRLQDPSKLNEAAGKAKNQIRFDLQGEATHILEHVLREYGDGEIYLEQAFGPRITKVEATPLLLGYIAENSLTESLTVHWCDNLTCSAKMMWKGPVVNCNRPELRKYSLWINGSDDNNYMRESGIQCLMDHEIGTHFFRMLNDGLQPWFSDRERFGLRNSGSFESKCTEEGLATINTVLRGRVHFLWGAAFAYYTACKSAEMTFRQLFDHIGRYTSNANYRWKQVMRVKRGLRDPNDLGGFGSDQCYFEGAVTILRNMENIDFQLLMSGKICYDEVDRIRRIVRKDCLRFPVFISKMAAYRKALRKICLLNGIQQKYPLQQAPMAYLKRLDERKMEKKDDNKNVNKGKGKKNQKGVRKKHKRRDKCNNQNMYTESDDDDDYDDDDEDWVIESFPISNNILKMLQYKREEAKRHEESCRIYTKFENVTKEVTALNMTIEQKIQDLRNIVKKHNWSNSEADYKENLFNQASCELKSVCSPKFETKRRPVSVMEEIVSDKEYLDILRPKSSLTNLENSESLDLLQKSASIKSQKYLDNFDFNSNSCRSKYIKKQCSVKQNENSYPVKVKRKTKTQILTDGMINEKLQNLKKKFLSDVNPHEIIFLEMPDAEEDKNFLGTSFSDVIIDIKDDIAVKLPAVTYSLKNATPGNNDEHAKPIVDKNQNKCMPVGTKQRPNFILRNKLLVKRPTITLNKATQLCQLMDKRLNDESDSDSDDSRELQKKVKKDKYAHIVSQYSQFQPVKIQKPKLDREILTADLCKPLFIQAERLLQAEKVLKKTRYHSQAMKKPKPHDKI